MKPTPRMNMLDIRATRNATRKKSELLAIIKNDPQTVKFTMRMPVCLHRDFKTLASKKGMNMTDIVNSILLNYIQSQLIEPPQLTEQP